MKKSAKTIAIAVMTIAALGGFAPAKADVSMGVTSGYMAVPASERWAAVQSRGNEALETSAAEIEAAVNSGDQAEAEVDPLKLATTTRCPLSSECT